MEPNCSILNPAQEAAGRSSPLLSITGHLALAQNTAADITHSHVSLDLGGLRLGPAHHRNVLLLVLKHSLCCQEQGAEAVRTLMPPWWRGGGPHCPPGGGAITLMGLLPTAGDWWAATAY